MSVENKGFNNVAFYAALNATRESRNLNWKEVSAETAVNASTLTRMSQDKKPDANSLAALSAWAGLNPADFVSMPGKVDRPETMAMIASQLRSDPKLSATQAASLEMMLKSVYQEYTSEPLKNLFQPATASKSKISMAQPVKKK